MVVLLILVAVMSSRDRAFSQINTYIRSIQAGEALEGSPLRVSAVLAKSTELARVVLYYRQFGQTEFRVLEMPISGDSASVVISADEVSPPFMEVYVQAQTSSGMTETYPYENPQATPTRITIAAKSPKDQEILILSPDKSEQLIPSDIYISVSFVYAGDIVDRKRTKIFFDNADVSSLAVLVGDLLIVSADALPKNIQSGVHTIRVDVFDTTGAPYHTIKQTFSVISQAEQEETGEKIVYAANAQAEGRNEDIQGAVTPYRRLTTNANASYGILKANGNMYLTSEEDPTRQPQNRYYLGLDAKYARVGIGDAYPRFPTTVMDGRRIRGVTADLLLGPFNMNYASGQVTRRVDVDSSQQVYSPTLARNLTAIRPSFGSGENFQLGFTYLKAKDEYGNADTIVKPQENVVMGSDMLVAFDNHHFELTGQTSYSLNNVDISAPEFTDASIDSSQLSSGTKDVLKKYGTKYLSKVITLNENLQPLPPGLTALVYETGLALNYFGNYLKGTYLYHGADYNSVGTTALRKDVKGYNVFDRIRLVQNTVFLTASYEHLQNNTAGQDTILTSNGLVQLTTTYNTFNSSVSYYPTTHMPNFTIGYGNNTDENPIDPYDKDTTVAFRAINDNTNRYFLQSTYDFSYWGRHNATLSFDVSHKIDNTQNKQDVKGVNAFLLINTVHTFPLESTFGYAMSLNTIPMVTIDTSGATPKTVVSSTSLNYTTITLNGRYRLYKDLLKLSATFAPTFGDFKRTVLEMGLQYAIAQNQSAAFQYQFIINSGTANDSYVSLIYRINL
ncbi:MAG TPA: hypothetical protein VMM58_08715 [Bacteroidota bacterium]|nr:hypothetical protein [Bacteroidota bacterium]